MKAATFIAIAINLICLEVSYTSKVFPSTQHGWLRQTNQDNQYEVIEQQDSTSYEYLRCFNLRGGASKNADEKNNESKIKGVCIGIDLGTTYR